MTTTTASKKQNYPATQRNRDVILNVLKQHLPEQGLVLEIASGSGEHITYFAPQFPNLKWQPSEPDAELRESITAWIAEGKSGNISKPLDINALDENWGIESVDVIFNANMIHISKWDTCIGLMKGAAKVLNKGGLIFLYGPFIRKDAPTAPSNLKFNDSLKQKNPDWGIRNLEDVVAEANKNNISLKEVVEMPANNLLVILANLKKE
jgi:hypothetical protein